MTKSRLVLIVLLALVAYGIFRCTPEKDAPPVSSRSEPVGWLDESHLMVREGDRRYILDTTTGNRASTDRL